MKERPILFSTEMVEAILGGRKTMTRRVVSFTKCKPFINHSAWPYVKKLEDNTWMWSDAPDFHYPKGYMKDGVKCPYGQVGDRLWVRETLLRGEKQYAGIIVYKAGNTPITDRYGSYVRWPVDRNYIPSIHMPRSLSRITLEITDIRVERLQDISLGDLSKEGVTLKQFGFDNMYSEFEHLWDSINAKRGYSWESNPWVWVISFRLTGESK
jgi:hypothetical protein